MIKRSVIALTAWLFLLGTLAPAQTTIRVGAFPNITHSQAMVGKSNGWFEKGMGPQVKIEWKSFNAGPSAIEALFAGAIDMTYIGPNPAISGYVRSNGEALRIVAGATSGGAALVVRNDSGIQKAEDFHGKKIASPQMGNTQDVALRAWLKAHGMKSTDKGGDVQVIPLANPDQLTLFLKKELDGAWAPEPWATRLIKEGNGHLFLDEPDTLAEWPVYYGSFDCADAVSERASRSGEELDSRARGINGLDQRAFARSEKTSQSADCKRDGESSARRGAR